MWNASQLLACHLVKTCFAFFLYKTSLSSPGCALFSLCIVWKVRVCLPSNARLSILSLYHVWLMSSHYCCFVFGRASRASMEKGRRAVCAQPWPPGCPEGKGAWRAVEKGKGVNGKKETFPLSSLSLSLFLWLLFIHSVLSFLFVPLTCFLGLLSLIFILPLPVGSLGVQLMSKSPTKTKKNKKGLMVN